MSVKQKVLLAFICYLSIGVFVSIKYVGLEVEHLTDPAVWILILAAPFEMVVILIKAFFSALAATF
ncbi:hypothetical protein [Vibrio parahaemolyticus]|uniref:hypothetical protein n=1 Tax=Vibrio parahaemolyticus TaxID=670 RepID=UPI001FAC0D64|nr:hypothetical protein [Vibrio parahaemolyticus]MCI9724368.1 hypothetical protein [Vibrio parahaemolyticus]